MLPANVHSPAFFHKRLRRALKRLGASRAYDISSFGKIGAFDLYYFCKPEKIDPDKKKILIAGGFHGDEPAGSWGIVRFLETANDADLNGANLCFLPLVNPTGFASNRRENDWHEDPNQGFGTDGKTPSHEGLLLLAHLDELLKAASDGFLSLHEDPEVQKGYVWTNEPAEKAPTAFTTGLRDVVSRHFEIFSGDMPHRGGSFEIKDGIGFNCVDNSFESLLIKNGVPRAAATESPADSAVPVKERIRCNKDLIRAFIATPSMNRGKIC